MSRLHPFKKAYQRNHIARSYATAWREADRAELAAFVNLVNSDGNDKWEVYPYPKRRQVVLSGEHVELRATLRPGAVIPITAGDITEFQRRQI